MADVLWLVKPKLSTVLCCGAVMVVSSLSLSLILVSYLMDGADEQKTAKLARWDGGYRNILDVHSVDVDRPADANYGVNEDQEAKKRTIEQMGEAKVVDAVNIGQLLSSERDHNTTESDCGGPWPGYPQCGEKMEWMEQHWQAEECYAQHGVDGSLCSIQIYLSEVETFCPILPDREKHLKPKNNTPTLQYEVDGLLEKIGWNVKFEWILNRIQRLWPEWAKALAALQARQPFSHGSANILIHIGALSDKAGFHFAENAGKGGPLGELVQWSDLIASLYALGYNMDFSTEISQLKEFLVVNNRGGCPTPSETRYVAVFLDIVGLKQLKKLTKNRFQMYKCLLRVLDTFGTEPVFNYKKWKPEKDNRNHDYGHTWGNWELNPRQFMTMYHNSFLGFVVEVHRLSSPLPPLHTNSSLVYGKELYMWENKQPYLEVIGKHTDVYATIGTTKPKGGTLDWSVVPRFVHNQGILGGNQLQHLLQRSRIFVGLGFPYEGPAPLEAAAQGCVFLNPKVKPPIDRSNSKFFARKPTNRKIDSQNPYMDMFVGKPYVYTIDASDLAEVESTVLEILKQPRPPPYIPYEFTFEGMLERITAYLNNQQYCRPHQWPPADMLVTRISEAGQSCKDTCYEEGLVCEPELFPLLNTEEALLSNGMKCDGMKSGHSVHAPSLTLSDSHCTLQEDTLLLSCAGGKDGVQRLCPCRRYRKGQVALCLTCSR